MEDEGVMAGQREGICQLAAAGRGGPRLAMAGRGLAEAGGRPELGLIWRWRGVLEGELGEASGPLGGCFRRA